MFLGSGAVLFAVFLVIEAQSVTQKKASWTKSKGKSVIFDCEATGLSSGDYVHWYQKKEGEPFKRVLYISSGTGSTTKDNDHPQNADFSGGKSGNAYKLKISNIKMIHAGTYYCACWFYHRDTNAVDY
ncbi:hypothetical protein JZ751_007608 [Albula glossodonta]|uniref:Ig-like domain-containing protein n=1 Tax=Albula glossodonta TaxID=121402 RepID=A0A8T2MNE5_9TELE|nr:hypothetical protein JZ751_007608 [Albula glossodonta]